MNDIGVIVIVILRGFTRSVRPVIVAMVALLAIAAIGCESTNTYQPAASKTAPNAADLKRIVTDGGMGRRAAVNSVYTGRPHGLLRVQVNVANRNTGSTILGPAELGFRYKFTWFDHQGMKVYDPSAGWKRKTLEAKEHTTLEGTAPSPDVVDWQLSLTPWTGY